MKRSLTLLSVLALSFFVFKMNAALIPEVRVFTAKADFAGAQKLLDAFEAKQGKTPEWLEAYSWQARGALNNKIYDKAISYAAETRKLALAELKKRPVDQEPRLPIALGASIEVNSQALAAQGSRSEAVAFLQQELKTYGKTSMRARIQKNLNLLAMEGKPAPAIANKDWLNVQPKALEAYRGKPVILFFWAHWCIDCKQQAPILAKLRQDFSEKGLVVIAPTRYYGYAARGEDATPEVERKYAEQVLKGSYSMLQGMPVTLDDETFFNYGASTTPTLVLIDTKGIVRLYHPGRMSYEELAEKIRAAN